jgi:hypothetical protein
MSSVGQAFVGLISRSPEGHFGPYLQNLLGRTTSKWVTPSGPGLPVNKQTKRLRHSVRPISLFSNHFSNNHFRIFETQIILMHTILLLKKYGTREQSLRLNYKII